MFSITMLPELGHFLLILGGSCALFGALLALLKYRNPGIEWPLRPLLLGQALGLTGAILLLALAFILNDFSVAYVANNSNSALPLFYKVAAVWGSHEGSLLFWMTVMALWAWLGLPRRSQDQNYLLMLHGSCSAILCGFVFFMLLYANPFARLLPEVPIEGRDLSPMLQDIGLILHPPLLFLGYAGLGICFCIALALLVSHKFSAARLGKLKRHLLLTWVFLTAGNALGSWWAYNELGWGGWWFWDPVENAAFIPWLVTTGALHCLLIKNHNPLAQLSALALVLLGFSLCLLGTFIVRSGIIQSVHAFAADPERGVIILLLLLLYGGAGFSLFGLRCRHHWQPGKLAPLGRDGQLLLGSLILLTMALTTLLGTLYPLFYQALGLGSLSVGAPYFNTLFVPMLALLLLPLALSTLPHMAPRRLGLLALVTVAATALALFFEGRLDPWLLAGGAMSLFLLCTLLLYLLPLGQIAGKRRNIPMLVAHTGLLVSIMGATGVSCFEQHSLLRMGPGQGSILGDYTFIYKQTRLLDKPAYRGEQAVIRVERNEQLLTYLYPERQEFNSNGMSLSQAAIYRGAFGDLYVSMGTQLSDEEFLVRLSIKPLVSWIWLGGGLMAIGGLLALGSRRRLPQTDLLTASGRLQHD
ncbi:heme lyase NrfEFG subunit NrfE [Shewanella algae]|uniref:heme lyase CcmF/NrfE family subunit n=1 Tax=Shewanella algae TaxID=38313 RepID=UPI001AACBA81|nr:heme lyase NrfEFG subunit NrfE [Shewanella algae]MBO2610461.1 heme lyase NrfEFG subunit NrfE [Shewanella algae]MBO2610480.1 heme lyase NrfEFG subunit NrfE [Shewanella algae]